MSAFRLLTAIAQEAEGGPDEHGAEAAVKGSGKGREVIVEGGRGEVRASGASGGIREGCEDVGEVFEGNAEPHHADKHNPAT